VRTVVDDDGAVTDPTAFLTAWTRPHTPVHRVDLYLAGELVEEDVTFTGGRISADRLSGVRTRMSGVNIPARTFDPRYSPDGWEIRVWRGLWLQPSWSYATLTDYITHDGDYVTQEPYGFIAAPGSASTVNGTDVAATRVWVSVGVFAIQDVDWGEASGEAVATVSGEDLARKIGDAALTASIEWTTSHVLETKLAELVQQSVPYLTFEASGTTHTAPAIVHERGADPMEILLESARSVGYEVFLRDYTVVWRPEPDLRSSSPVVELAEGETWVEGEMRLSRQDTHNAWTVVGTNPDVDDVEYVATVYDDDVNSLTYYYGPFGRKPAPDERSELADTQAKVDAAAEALRLKNRGRSRAISVSSWPCPVLEPGDAVTLRRGVFDMDEVVLLDEIDFGLSVSDAMRVVCRTKQVA
jgi:hypothetical protein